MPQFPDLASRFPRIKGRRLYIATPVARNPVWQYTVSLASTVMELGRLGVACQFEFVIGISIIPRARNELCARFLASDATDLLFIDDDMQWRPDGVLRLLASDAKVIGGVGRMRCQKPNSDPDVWCWRPLYEAGGKLKRDCMGAIEVLGLGSAFLRIDRSMLETMIAQHPERKLHAPADWPQKVRDNYYQFYAMQVTDNGHFTGEDYAFCELVREAGGRCWIDPEIRLGHIGAYTYAGAVTEIIRPET